MREIKTHDPIRQSDFDFLIKVNSFKEIIKGDLVAGSHPRRDTYWKVARCTARHYRVAIKEGTLYRVPRPDEQPKTKPTKKPEIAIMADPTKIVAAFKKVAEQLSKNAKAMGRAMGRVRRKELIEMGILEKDPHESTQWFQEDVNDRPPEIQEEKIEEEWVSKVESQGFNLPAELFEKILPEIKGLPLDVANRYTSYHLELVSKEFFHEHKKVLNIIPDGDGWKVEGT